MTSPQQVTTPNGGREADGRSPLPVAEAHIASFVGWLSLQRQAGRRSLATASTPQYFGVVRQIQVALTGIPVPHYQFLTHVIRDHEKWEGDTYPQPDVRMGIDGTTIQKLWDHGMTSSIPSMLRDSTVYDFAHCFNGLRESCILSLRTENVEISDTAMTNRLSLWNRKREDLLSLIGYHRISTLSSQLDVWKRGLFNEQLLVHRICDFSP